jgi:drug/metabolite transporter (DMT)-like permease
VPVGGGISIRNLIALTLIRPIRRLDRTLSKPQPAWRIILFGAGMFTVLGAIAYAYPLAGIWIGGTIVGLLYIGALACRTKDRVQYAPVGWALFIVSLLSSLGDG